MVIEDGDEDELIEDEDLPAPPPPSTSTTTSTTTTSKPITTGRPANRLAVTRRRPLNSQLATSGSTAIPIITSTPARASIVIAIPAPLIRPLGDDFSQKTPSVAPSSAPISSTTRQQTQKRPQFSTEQDDINGNAEVFQQQAVGSNSAGNVVEIDEDGRVFCYDIGNFAYPEDCRQFVQCARPGDHEPIKGWVHTCPRGLSFDPVGAICNWGSPVRCRQS